MMDMAANWTPLQRYYFPTYFWMTSGQPGKGAYRFLFAVCPGGARLASNQDVIRGMTPGKGQTLFIPFTLTSQARKAGATTLEWRSFPQLENATAYQWLFRNIYNAESPWELVEWPVFLCLICVLVLLPWAFGRGRKWEQAAKQGHTLRGPRLVTRSQFNQLKQSDGIGFPTLERATLREFLFEHGRERHMVRIPRKEESSHFALMGDSGTGKSSLIRQLLLQIRARGETAVVFDPELEFTTQFYEPATDVILNPTDERMPFWTPSDEVQYPPEATTLAESLFPDKPHDNPFFTQSARKIFAHLLRYRPTPQDLTAWMKNMDEIDRRIAGTEMEAMLAKGAAGQRAAVQGTFNQAGAAFQLLPNEQESKGRWSAAAWAGERKGWLFLPSTPTLRESVKPLVSMWLDSLILRLMASRQTNTAPVWFIVDELATLQRLPQLPVAITQGRKANIRLVLGFQGRSQLETLYGGQAEVMLSQPLTKVFMRTGEPDAANWISRSIGEIEVMRLEETRTENIPVFFEQLHRSKSQHWQRRTEPLVMASTIEGLRNLTGYIKSHDLVVSASFPRMDAQQLHPGFMPHPLPQLETLPSPQKNPAAPSAAPAEVQLVAKTAHQQDLERGSESKEFDIFE
jgi:type IV secretory pathway TraG/TraD family ATPase VirD4